MKIFLVGMMGCGKSYWTSRLSKQLRIARYDLDQLVQEVEDRSILDIFRESGEEHFRKMESIVLRWFEDKDDFVLATGGGTPCHHDNMSWMNEHGVTIWLDEPVEVLAKRLLPEKEHRPLIASLSEDQLKAYLEAKIKEREPFYSQATHRLKKGQINEAALLAILKQS